MKNRKTRREQTKRIKRRVKRLLKDIWHDDALAENDTFIGKYSTTRVMCSDPLCCGNQRRISNSEKNKTLQEQRADLDETEE